MARIYEYQGKEVLRNKGIRVPQGRVVTSPEEAKEAAAHAGKPVVLKAQVWATGRFKAGGIKFAGDPDDAEKAALELLGSTVKGLTVDRILVEEQLAIDSEYYLGIIVNDSVKVKGPTLIFSTEGGVGVEEVAARNPERVVRMNINSLQGLGSAEEDRFVDSLPFDEPMSPDLARELSGVIGSLYRAFVDSDARAAEINPLVLTHDRHFYAADCRLTIDDNSVFRHPEFGIELPRDMTRQPTELERIAWQIEGEDYRGTGYFTQMVSKMDGPGWVGLHGIGGGGSMIAATALIARGFRIANYADTSGDPTAGKVYRVIKCILSQPIDSYVLMGSCLANQEQWHHAHAIVKIFREEAHRRPGFPVILLLAGNKEAESHEIIRNGLRDLPLRWELYGREYIYKTEFMANRVAELMAAYQEEKAR